jgi:hypothetical protein
MNFIIQKVKILPASGFQPPIIKTLIYVPISLSVIGVNTMPGDAVVNAAKSPVANKRSSPLSAYKNAVTEAVKVFAKLKMLEDMFLCIDDLASLPSAPFTQIPWKTAVLRLMLH